MYSEMDKKSETATLHEMVGVYCECRENKHKHKIAELQQKLKFTTKKWKFTATDFVKIFPIYIRRKIP